MLITRVLAGVAVADIEAARAWYERLVSSPADGIPMPSVAKWCVTGTGWTQLATDAERAGSPFVTLDLDDIYAEIEALTARGFSLDASDTAFGMFRIATVADPDGNTITFAQDLCPGD